MKDIVGPIRITHLLCFNPSRGDLSGLDQCEFTAIAADEMTALQKTSPKVNYTERSNARKETNIQIVWEDWFWDCLSRSGRCDESGYKVGVVAKKQA